ncbi:MAG TPA: DUF362 domain-containing protein [Candidatus Bathyarchaeia archaeon]|nr:DUF362 domain-containing protein [Candidatus Bathyarchaeia archaeon]
MKPKVFFADIRSRKSEEAATKKVEKLFDISDTADVIKKHDIVALKVHFGERNNLRGLRPQLVRVIVNKVKDLGGRPFVTDTNGCGYWRWPTRTDALRHLQTAAENGFTSETVGAPIIIADGVKGLRGTWLNVNGLHFKKVNVANDIVDADSIICISHFKGHPDAGVGGALKNMGIGCGTKYSKARCHWDSVPKVIEEKCDGCGDCIQACPFDAMSMVDGKPVIDAEKCWMGDQACQAMCGKKAIKVVNTSTRNLSERMVDVAAAVINHVGKKKIGYFNFLNDVTAHCDCYDFGDLPVIPDIGFLASKDPVAIDRASIDLVNAAPTMKGSIAQDVKPGEDMLNTVSPQMQYWRQDKEAVDWRWQINAAKKLKLGNDEYTLVRVA